MVKGSLTRLPAMNCVMLVYVGGTYLQEYYLPYILENKILVTLKRCFEYEKVLWAGKVGHFVGNGGQECNRFDRDHH